MWHHQCQALICSLFWLAFTITLAISAEGNYDVTVPRSFGFEHKRTKLTDASYEAVEQIVSAFGMYYVFVCLSD